MFSGCAATGKEVRAQGSSVQWACSHRPRGLVFSGRAVTGKEGRAQGPSVQWVCSHREGGEGPGV